MFQEKRTQCWTLARRISYVWIQRIRTHRCRTEHLEFQKQKLEPKGLIGQNWHFNVTCCKIITQIQKMQKLNSKWVLSEFTPSCLEIPTCLEMCYIPRAIRMTLIIKKPVWSIRSLWTRHGLISIWLPMKNKENSFALERSRVVVVASSLGHKAMVTLAIDIRSFCY